MIRIESLHSSDFNWQAALTLANCSKLVYQREVAVKRMLTDRVGFETCDFIDISDTQLFVATKGKVTVVAFRGSSELGDWLKNFNTLFNDEPTYGRVHSGIYGAYHDAHAALVALLDQLPDDQMIWMTGHSLGGALATIALAELADSHGDRIAGCYTYGQPRTGDRAFRRFMRENYGDRFFRFVNDDDLVTRIPPFFSHVVQLIRFGPDGELLRAPDEVLPDGFESMLEIDVAPDEFDPTVESDGESFAEADGAEDAGELPAISEARFEQLQAALREGDSLDSLPGLEASVAGDPSDPDAAAEGFLPSIRDHDISGYISKIMRFERVSDTRTVTIDVPTDPHVEMAVEIAAEESNRGTLSPFESAVEAPLIPVVIKASPSWLPPDDVQINSTIGSIYTALVTPDQLVDLQADRMVHSLERSPDQFLVDVAASVPFTKADVVHRPPLNERGDRAIVGIVDTGIDVLHEAFTMATDPTKSRILYVWDQRGSEFANKSPAEVNPDFSARYGRLYTRDEIEAFMQGSGNVPNRLRNPSSSGGHGTHVSGIAAGRAVGLLGDGVAPDAQIAVVIPKLQVDPDEEEAVNSIGYSVTHLDALVFLKEVSGVERMPMAINVSLGMNAGSHDGSSTLEAGFDAITGQGRLPGIVIVKSAGNERGHHGHAKVNATTNLVETVTWKSRNIARPEDYIEVWYDDFDDLEFTLIAPSRQRSPAIFFDPSEDDPTRPKVIRGEINRNRFELRLTETHPDNGNSLLQIMIMPGGGSNGAQIRRGTWKLEIVGRDVVSEEGRVDLWIERDNRRAIKFEEGADKNMTLSVPGTANTVITVAACAPEGPPIRLTSSSSYGPTRNGGEKPEIAAPGHKIVAARSNTSDHTEGVAKTGTSMAAPHVTGAIALAMSMIEKRPNGRQLNAQQFRQLLIKHAMDSSRNHHPGRGFGVLDVQAFLDSI